MSWRSCFVGVRSQTWRPIRPGRVSAGSSCVDRDVRRADEVDLVLARLRPRDAELEPADARRDEVRRVEERVRPVREEPPEERRVVDPVHDDEQLVQRQLAPAAHHPRERAALVEDPGEPAGLRGLALPLGEEAVAPGARLEDHVAGRVERAVRARRRASPRAGRRCTYRSTRRRAPRGACRRRRSRR